VINLYVSPDGDDTGIGTEQQPWKSLHRAAEGLREILAGKRGEDIVVRLSPGTHRLSESLVLGPEHSGSADTSVSFLGSGAGETVLSSGYALQGWTRVGEDMPDVPKELRGKVWMTDLPEGTIVNTLYRKDGPVPRARGEAIQPQPLSPTEDETAPPNYGPNGEAGFRGILSHEAFAFPDGAIKPAEDLQEAECLIIPRMQWTMNILPVKRVDFSRNRVELGENCTYPIGIPHCAPEGSIWLENSLSVLKPGTWVYHAGTARLYYCPEGESPEERSGRSATFIWRTLPSRTQTGSRFTVSPAAGSSTIGRCTTPPRAWCVCDTPKVARSRSAPSNTAARAESDSICSAREIGSTAIPSGTWACAASCSADTARAATTSTAATP